MHKTMSEHAHDNHSVLDVTGSEGAGRGSSGAGDTVTPAPTCTPRADAAAIAPATDQSQSRFITPLLTHMALAKLLA